VAGVYRHRYPKRIVFYRVLFYDLDPFLAEQESRFEKE
jgi:hypothetical protein